MDRRTTSDTWVRVDRLVPAVPPAGTRLRLVIDSDVGNEIDDFYAIASALASPDRFDLKGISAAHFNNSRPGAGPGSIEKSVELAHSILDAAGMLDAVKVVHGCPPMQYFGHPSPGDGADFMIEEARAASPDDPLWVVILGAATSSASAILMDPSIAENVRFVFHARSDFTWPTRSVQFNVKGDIHAARTLLASRVPLVWFDTGTHLTIPYALSREVLRPLGRLGAFLHDFRDQEPWFARDDKGFFDMGDIAYLIDPGICREEVTNVPRMDEHMQFDFSRPNGKMVRVFDIENNAAWNLLFEKLRRFL